MGRPTMYGLLAGCGQALQGQARGLWQRHLCGLCESLSRAFGPPARLLATPDAALLSLLVEAQTPVPLPASSPSRCLARRPFYLQVAATRSPGSRFARSIAVLAAAARMEDAVRDADLSPAWLARLAAAILRPAARRAHTDLDALGFDASLLTRAARDAAQVESASRGFDALVAPTERAYAAVFGHTVALAGRPSHLEEARAMGRWFGRLAYLEDARTDCTRDLARQRFNPLAACFGAEARSRGAALAAAAVERLSNAVARLQLVRHEHVVARLLSPRVNRRIAWACGRSDGAQRIRIGKTERDEPPARRPRRWSEPRCDGDTAPWCCSCCCDPCCCCLPFLWC